MSGLLGYNNDYLVQIDAADILLFASWVGAGNTESVVQIQQVQHATSSSTGKYVATFIDPVTLADVRKSKTGYNGGWS